jgi:hypothetical protein
LYGYAGRLNAKSGGCWLGRGAASGAASRCSGGRCPSSTRARGSSLAGRHVGRVPAATLSPPAVLYGGSVSMAANGGAG